jgi:hypothetical protein
MCSEITYSPIFMKQNILLSKENQFIYFQTLVTSIKFMSKKLDIKKMLITPYLDYRNLKL